MVYSLIGNGEMTSIEILKTLQWIETTSLRLVFPLDIKDFEVIYKGQQEYRPWKIVVLFIVKLTFVAYLCQRVI